MTTHLLQSESVRLRPIEISDLPLMYRLENDTTMWDTSNAVQPLSRSIIERFINTATGDIYKDGQLRFVIELYNKPVPPLKAEELPYHSDGIDYRAQCGKEENPSEDANASVGHYLKKSVGFIDLTNFSPRHMRAEVALALLPQYQQCGIGTEALRLLEEYATQTLFLHQLYAFISPENAISLRLFQSAGYKQAGTLHDWQKTTSSYLPTAIFQKIL